jgi:hypothetical protein
VQEVEKLLESLPTPADAVATAAATVTADASFAAAAAAEAGGALDANAAAEGARAAAMAKTEAAAAAAAGGAGGAVSGNAGNDAEGDAGLRLLVESRSGGLLAMRRAPASGRFLVASARMGAGTDLMEERPAAFVVSKRQRALRCADVEWCG